MLSHLSIDNFAIASHMEIEFHRGTTVITGETGAGKSIMLDALGLALGGRADPQVVKVGSERAEIYASFDISKVPAARQWLADKALLDSASDTAITNECILRRTITREGRSRAYINGHPSTLQDLKTLSEMLIDIHSQHAHQSLLKADYQRQILDSYANTQSLADDVKSTAQQHQQLLNQLTELETNQSQLSAKAQLLGYQVEELDTLALEEGELEKLENEQKMLAGGESILQSTQHALALCKEGELNVINILNQAMRSLEQIPVKSKTINEAEQLLGSALIQVEEASCDLQQHIDNFELDPERQLEVESRLGLIFETARKHRIQPKQLPELHQRLRDELKQISGSDQQIETLQAELASLQQHYDQLASKLSKKRKAAASKFQKQVEQQLQALSMNNCQIQIALTTRDCPKPHPKGNEEINFLVSTNPGQTPQPLSKVASGGELSRISLAIQVISAQTNAVPSMVFDEVDVGIGGATAEVVGNLLRSLGEQGQVICVTHQAQVASKGHQHLFVSKQILKKQVITQLQELQETEKIEEIARMLGGIAMTKNTLAHAKEMLTISH